jgi:TfoX/Sxy family transcriptional regulator of competence genes
MPKAKWRKSPPELIARFSEIVPGDPLVERRQMFGYPCAFTRGNMFIGLHQENLVLRLPAAERAEFLSQKGARAFEPMPERAMKEYVVVPPELLADLERLEPWVRVAFRYAASLPPKTKKPIG